MLLKVAAIVNLYQPLPTSVRVFETRADEEISVDVSFVKLNITKPFSVAPASELNKTVTSSREPAFK